MMGAQTRVDMRTCRLRSARWPYPIPQGAKDFPALLRAPSLKTPSGSLSFHDIDEPRTGSFYPIRRSALAMFGTLPLRMSARTHAGS